MISLIIVNYNSDKHIYKCLKSINDSVLEKLKLEIIIVNNSRQLNNELFSFSRIPIRYIDIGKNIGYSKAINIGINKSRFKTIITMNPDVVLMKDSILNIFNYFNNNDKIGVIGCKVLNVDMTFQKSSRRRFPFFRVVMPYILRYHFFGLINKYNYMDYSKDTIHEVDSVSGSFMMFNKSEYISVNGFDERFFLYFEDTDFCYKIKKLGFINIYYPESEIIHIKYGSRNYINYIFIQLIFYLSFLKFILKYNKFFFKLDN